MKHHPTILEGPIRTAYELCSDKTVLNEQLIIGERILIKEMAKSFIESLIIFVSDGKQSILDAECSSGSSPTSFPRIFGTQPVKSRPLKSAIQSSSPKDDSVNEDCALSCGICCATQAPSETNKSIRTLTLPPCHPFESRIVVFLEMS